MLISWQKLLEFFGLKNINLHFFVSHWHLRIEEFSDESRLDELSAQVGRRGYCTEEMND